MREDYSGSSRLSSLLCNSLSLFLYLLFYVTEKFRPQDSIGRRAFGLLSNQSSKALYYILFCGHVDMSLSYDPFENLE